MLRKRTTRQLRGHLEAKSSHRLEAKGRGLGETRAAAGSAGRGRAYPSQPRCSVRRNREEGKEVQAPWGLMVLGRRRVGIFGEAGWPPAESGLGWPPLATRPRTAALSGGLPGRSSSPGPGTDARAAARAAAGCRRRPQDAATGRRPEKQTQARMAGDRPGRTPAGRELPPPPVLRASAAACPERCHPALFARGVAARPCEFALLRPAPALARPPLSSLDHFCWDNLTELCQDHGRRRVSVEEPRLHELILDGVEPLPASKEACRARLPGCFCHLVCSCQYEFLGFLGRMPSPAAARSYHKMWLGVRFRPFLCSCPPVRRSFGGCTPHNLLWFAPLAVDRVAVPVVCPAAP